MPIVIAKIAVPCGDNASTRRHQFRTKGFMIALDAPVDNRDGDWLFRDRLLAPQLVYALPRLHDLHLVPCPLSAVGRIETGC